MSLPSLNDKPEYTLTVPSNGKKVNYRPYLVKEEKVLLMAAESKDENEIIRAIENTVGACVDDSIDVSQLCTFDLEYIFLQLRSKSTGENSEILIKCQSCDEKNEVIVPLGEVECTGSTRESNIIELTKEISLEMRYPSYRDMNLSSNNEDKFGFEVILRCIEAVLTEEERIVIGEEKTEDVEKFVESMTQEQFKKIIDFIQGMPSLTYDLNFICQSCGAANEREIRGIQSFF